MILSSGFVVYEGVTLFIGMIAMRFFFGVSSSLLLCESSCDMIHNSPNIVLLLEEPKFIMSTFLFPT